MPAVTKSFPAFDMMPITQELLSPEEFLDRLPEIREQIESVTPVPPVPGQPGFGRIRVVYRRPIYKFLSAFVSQKDA